MISFAGGTIAWSSLRHIPAHRLARRWSTIVTFSSIALAFLVSISVGWCWNLSATKAARLDPVEAIRYE